MENMKGTQQDKEIKTRRKTTERRVYAHQCNNTYLHTVHFIFADDFDGNFTSVALQVAGAIYVTKRTIAHLFNQLPPFQAGISRELGPAGVFLGHELGQACIVNTFRGGGCGPGVYILGRLCLMGRGNVGLGNSILAIPRSFRVGVERFLVKNMLVQSGVGDVHLPVLVCGLGGRCRRYIILSQGFVAVIDTAGLFA